MLQCSVWNLLLIYWFIIKKKKKKTIFTLHNWSEVTRYNLTYVRVDTVWLILFCSWNNRVAATHGFAPFVCHVMIHWILQHLWRKDGRAAAVLTCLVRCGCTLVLAAGGDVAGGVGICMYHIHTYIRHTYIYLHYKLITHVYVIYVYIKIEDWLGCTPLSAATPPVTTLNPFLALI